MDYMTKPASRINMRLFAVDFRKLFGVRMTGSFPVLEVLDKISDVFPGCNYEILDDKHFPRNIKARCVPNGENGYTIEIRESVYNDAYKYSDGACLGFICHEICHIYLFVKGFTPIIERSFANNTVPPYRSVEWQAKALCGEVMIPYEESKGMSVQQICATYHCSKTSAKYRVDLDKKIEVKKAPRRQA